MDYNNEETSTTPTKKTIKVEKAINEMLNIQEDKHEPLIIRRKELAKRLNCTPHLISYVIQQINKNNEYVIKSKRGINGWIQIKRKISLRELLDQRPISQERKNEIEICLQNTMDLYFENVIDKLEPSMVYNRNTFKKIIRNISYVVLKENKTSNDIRLIHILQETINKSLTQDSTEEIDMNGITFQAEDIGKDQIAPDEVKDEELEKNQQTDTEKQIDTNDNEIKK